MWKMLRHLFAPTIDRTEKKIDALRRDMHGKVRKVLKDQTKIQKLAVQYDGNITKDILRSSGFQI